MTPAIETTLHWTPRVLCLLFAGFLSIFALDVFDEGRPLGQTVLALLVHLTPTWLVLGSLAVAWRWGVAGGLLFAGLGAYYIVMAWGRFPWLTYVVVAGPLFLVAALFVIDALYRARLRPGAG